MPADPVTDYRVLAAVAHPLRRRLLDLLRADGPATATTLAARTGAAVGSVSHHARVLAAHGLVLEAPELARDGRERWWRLGDARVSWSTRDFADDPAGAAASSAAEELGLRRQLELLDGWRSRTATADPAWVDAAHSTDMWMRLTPDELRTMSAELDALLQAWRTRALPDDGAEREAVFVFARAFPARP